MNGYDHETYNLEKEKCLWPDKDERSLGRSRIKNHLHTFILLRAFEDTKSELVLLRTVNLFRLIQNPRKFKGIINAQPSEKAGNSLQFHPQNVSKFMNSQFNFPLWKNCSGL